jgi:S-formylglutathione hydrolase FrmB
MGGHGALTTYLSSLLAGTKQYRSCSAFSPICEPSTVPWGMKAFTEYLAGGVEEGKDRYDASVLVGRVKGAINVLIDYVRFLFSKSVWEWRDEQAIGVMNADEALDFADNRELRTIFSTSSIQKHFSGPHAMRAMTKFRSV